MLQKTFYKILFLLPLFCNTSIFSQAYKNNIFITGGNVFFPDWEPRTNSLGLGYSKLISNNWIIQANIFVNISNENLMYEPSKEFSYETVYYNEIWYRNLINFDLSTGYKLWTNKVDNLFLIICGGLSFIYGEETILESIWYGSFPEGESTINHRHHPGFNAEFNFSYYPIKHFGLGIYSTGHIYTKYDPDLNLGASIYFRFGGSTSSL